MLVQRSDKPLPNREQVLLDFIRTNLSQDASRPVGADEPMCSSGLVDSFGIVEILGFIEDEWGVSIPDQEATAKQFDRVTSILALVDQYDE